MSRFLSRVKRELVEAIPPAVFFFVAFHVIAFTRALVLQVYGIPTSTFVAVTIAALILFFLYCTMRELIRVLGRERVRALFFGPPTMHTV